MRRRRCPSRRGPWVCLLIGLLVGMYDGFVGPGTGTFLMLAFSAFCRMDLVRASGSAKLVNLASNLAAMLTFLSSGSVLVALADPGGPVLDGGQLLGASLAVHKGARFIRPLSFAVLALLLVTIAVERFARVEFSRKSKKRPASGLHRSGARVFLADARPQQRARPGERRFRRRRNAAAFAEGGRRRVSGAALPGGGAGVGGGRSRSAARPQPVFSGAVRARAARPRWFAGRSGRETRGGGGGIPPR